MSPFESISLRNILSDGGVLIFSFVAIVNSLLNLVNWLIESFVQITDMSPLLENIGVKLGFGVVVISFLLIQVSIKATFVILSFIKLKLSSYLLIPKL